MEVRHADYPGVVLGYLPDPRDGAASWNFAVPQPLNVTFTDAPPTMNINMITLTVQKVEVGGRIVRAYNAGKTTIETLRKIKGFVPR